MMWSSAYYLEVTLGLFYRVIVRCASCVMLRQLTLENKYSNIFFYKTISPTVLKFYMEHDLAPGSQNYKLGQVEYTRWPPLLKIAKITKSTFSPEPLDIFGWILAWNINGTQVFRIVKMIKICSVVLSQ